MPCGISPFLYALKTSQIKKRKKGISYIIEWTKLMINYSTHFSAGPRVKNNIYYLSSYFRLLAFIIPQH